MTKVFKEMIEHDAAGGILLVIAAIIAMIFANSALSGFYTGTLDIPIQVSFGDFIINKPLVLWVNDGLMAIFFLVVGLEVKREIIEGHLSSVDQIVLPAIGAVAGIAIPALVYAAINSGDEITMRGWAIPSATDIAFALGLFTLFGKHLPLSLKLFLLSVAIFDDIGAIIIIAVFYSSDLSQLSLIVASAGLVILFVINRLGIKKVGPYLLVGVVVWAAVLKSGVHATLAGFAIAWFIPIHVKNDNGNSLLRELEHDLHPWVAFFILPVFAFANAGVSLSGVGMEALTHPITLGIVLGLFVGKQVGIFGACWLAIKLGLAKLPSGANFVQLYGVSILCGIGFTMSLFIGSLAFENMAKEYIDAVKLGVLVGSLLSVIAASIILVKFGKNTHEPDKSAIKAST
ncbi:sodium:proton antiporter [Oleiphilus sp. HI0071]|uniref:Na+/H+ antiporter NhaA n=3 Tax=unclassified Oleiphilus TaxID=2631174 RepID=UPI0007C38CDC|nr:Na+/H+ antiporter NhaA [Oleiphilus sp. HI0079]KZY72485.1 sodium:proton antiporter [Oleiphilus sp. HI0065]KZY83674.1 sodium:proton antiporter [Oleiphilus sp. HI0071]KZZ04755.1 sodium:proton antiporter [Oleiphilus sp. HI0073]KZZ44932.1 sodium:proton antiporter [Oleiphilus sp. HI0118]KZZ52672.1 sodium:proton antiporter [Oleiphilus sp. HI0122]KZZ81089.1 sodium:proton antiporter [Oleiphilus sp. HI0133]